MTVGLAMRAGMSFITAYDGVAFGVVGAVFFLLRLL